MFDKKQNKYISLSLKKHKILKLISDSPVALSAADLRELDGGLKPRAVQSGIRKLQKAGLIFPVDPDSEHPAYVSKMPYQDFLCKQLAYQLENTMIQNLVIR